MEIQQHNGVVVDVAGLRQGFAELLRARERCCRGGGRRPRLLCAALPPPLYIGPLGGRRPREMGSPRGGGGQGVECPPSQVGRPPTLGFPTLGAWGGPRGAHQPTMGWLPSPL